MASPRLPIITLFGKPRKPPRAAVTARVCRNLHELTKDRVVPSDELKADYDWYLSIKRRQGSAAS